MVSETPVLERGVPPILTELAAQLDSKTHLLASGGDEELSKLALNATKSLFDLALELEQHSHPHLHPFLAQILEPPTITLRSKSKSKKSKSTPEPEAEPPKPEEVLPYTPLSVLTVDGLGPEQVWEQMELRAPGIARIVKEVGGGEAAEQDDLEGEEVEEGDSEDEEEDGSDEEMTIEEFERMMAEHGDSDDDEDDDDDEDEDEDEDEEVEFDDEEEDEEEDEDMIAESDEEGGDELEDEDEDGLSLEEAEGDEEEDDGDEEDEEDEEGADVDGLEDDEMDGDEDDDQEALFSQPGPSRSKRHPTLDDEFFSIDEFNRSTEEAEASRISGGRLGGDEDEEDENDLGDLGSMMLRGADEDDPIMYGDFFEKPRGAAKPSSTKGKGKGDGKKKSKGKGVRFMPEEDEAEEDDGNEEDEEDPREVMGRIKGDLFDDDDEEVAEQNLSTHERRQLELAKQIAELEQEAIGPKDWQLLGEASSRARPENSLLEEDLDFEQVGKVVPVVTEESVKSLEDMIKARILDNNFNSTVRVRAYEPTPFLPSRYFDLQDQQSSKSLAQIYEDEYQAVSSGERIKDPRDERLKKEHDEIDKLWGEICYKLDALSSLNFVPKQPKAQITTIENIATTSMESALPTTSASSTMLAPEELFAPPQAASLVARSELTPEEKQRARAKARKGKQTQVKRLGGMAELYGKKRKGAKEQKDEALKGLVKSGKGVTVVGKGDKERGKAEKRAADGERSDGKRLKL